MNRCKTCVYYMTALIGHGSCGSKKFIQSYQFDKGDPFKGIGSDCVRLEDDEGWGMIVGDDFGCVHHEVMT